MTTTVLLSSGMKRVITPALPLGRPVGFVAAYRIAFWLSTNSGKTFEPGEPEKKYAFIPLYLYNVLLAMPMAIPRFVGEINLKTSSRACGPNRPAGIIEAIIYSISKVTDP